MVNELSSIMQQSRGPLLEGVKVFSKAFLLEYRRIMGGALDWKDSDWMSDEELKDLADLAVFTYLEMWLEKDKASYLTIESFANHGYGETSDTSDDHKDRIAWKAALHRAYKLYEDMYKKGQLQNKELSERTHPAPYKVDNKRKLSLLDLAWCEAWASGKIEILKLLFFLKTLPNRKSEHDAMQNELLRDALNRYAQFVNGIRDGYPTDKEQIDQYKAYIARCILVQKLERAYRFGLAGYLADHAVKNGYKPDAYNQELFSAYTGMYQDEIGMLISNKKLLGKDGERKYKKSFFPYHTLGYEEIPEKVFEMCESEQIEHAYAAEIHRRGAMDNLIEMLCVCGQIEQRRWKDEDFRAAVVFLGNEYQFLERLRSGKFRYRQVLSTNGPRAGKQLNNICRNFWTISMLTICGSMRTSRRRPRKSCRC